MSHQPFTWMPAQGRRHATADENPRRGDTITTLCGQDLTAAGWDRLPPEQQPSSCHYWPDMPAYWPTCLDCEAVWVAELARAQTAASERVR